MQNIIIIAGETSADLHGAALAHELKNLNPSLKIHAVGGKKMREEGVNIFADLTPYAVIGFFEVLKHLRIFKKTFELVLKKIRELNPNAIILIDFPGFNLRLAKRINKDFPAVKIIYYISPQIWAWGKERIKLIKETVDNMIVFFEFEKELYARHNVKVEFVGHPLLDIVKITKNKEECYEILGFSKEKPLIGLLPGSREAEVKRILPLLLASAELIAKKIPNAVFILFKAPTIKNNLIQPLLSRHKNLTIRIVDDNTYNYLHACSFAWTCSGTATLETAIITTPMLITYKTSFLTWLISKLLIKIPYIGLVNIVAQEKIVPEFIQYQATPEHIADTTLDILLNHRKNEEIKEKLSTVRSKLGENQANKKAALVILQTLH